MKVAVLTSGGDAPGMNAAIRAVTRTALHRGWDVFGVLHGYAGLVAGDMRPLGPRDVGGIVQSGGTMLGSARCPEFREEWTQREALRRLETVGIEALFVIGGNGSQIGAYALSRLGMKVVGIASTIDNDLYGSDITIGVDTALNIALEAIDRLKVTASSHHRTFLVEVMGRDCGYLALMAAVAGGAEAVLIPEAKCDPEEIANVVQRSYARGKAHALIVVAEGAEYDADRLAGWFNDRQVRLGLEVRLTRLGHVQRGGAPGASDRILATELGAGATDCLARGEHGILVGQIAGRVAATPLAEVVGKRKTLDLAPLELLRILAE